MSFCSTGVGLTEAEAGFKFDPASEQPKNTMPFRENGYADLPEKSTGVARRQWNHFSPEKEKAGVDQSAPAFLLRRPDSAGRNGWHRRKLCAFKFLAQQLVKRMCWTVPVEHFPWPIVEHDLHPLNLAS